MHSEGSEKQYDVSGLGNPLVDVLAEVDDGFIVRNGLNKGIMHLIDRQRKEELLDLLRDRELVTEAGGSCPNTIVTLALLGLSTALTGNTGNDLYGDIFEQKIKEKNVDSYLNRVECDTGICTILITPDKERTMNTYLGACREYGAENIPEDMVARSKIFYFTGYMWDTECQKAAVTRAIDIAKTNGVLVAFDIADPFCVDRHRGDFLSIVSDKADIVFANAREACLLRGSPEDDDIGADAVFLGKLCPLAVIKNGSEDTLIIRTGSETVRVPSFQSDVKDTTGAGDNFAAGFLYGMIRDLPLSECGRIAAFVASKTIEKIGAQAPENIRELMDSPHLYE